jgi:hypothetical protein
MFTHTTDHPCPSKGGELHYEQSGGEYVRAKFPSFGGAGVVAAKL